MSQHDPPAPDLDLRLARLHAEVDGWKAGTVEVDLEDVQALLAAYDRQTELLEMVLLKHQDAAARLAAWEGHQCPQYRQHHQSRLVQLRRTITEREALAARLVAVERALQWAVTTLEGYQTDVPGTEHWMGGWADWLEQQARPALAAPSGESP